MRFKVLILFVSMTSTSNAMTLTEKKDALNSIVESSEKICNEIPVKGEKENIELSGAAKTKLNSLIKMIASIDIDGIGKYQLSTFSGVLQKDLAPLLKNNSTCKLEVLKELNDKLLPSGLFINTTQKTDKIKELCSQNNIRSRPVDCLFMSERR